MTATEIDADVAIVGGGPAGLTAATWLARHRRSAVVVDSSEYRNRWVDSSHGYLGNDPISPHVLRGAPIETSPATSRCASSLTA